MLFSKTVVCEMYSEREKKWGKGEKKKEAIHGEVGMCLEYNHAERRKGRTACRLPVEEVQTVMGPLRKSTCFFLFL